MAGEVVFIERGQVQLALARAGFIPAGDATDEALIEALREFQKWHNLPVDANGDPQDVDEETARILLADRICKMPDNFSGADALRRGQINRWAKRNLKILIDPRAALPGIPRIALEDSVMLGFRGWDNGHGVCGLTFDLARSGRGDIVVTTGFIDGPLQVLGWNELPMIDGHDSPLQMKLDTGDKYAASVNPPPRYVPLPTVVMHEGGHGIGLSHTNVRNQLMNPTLSSIKAPQSEWDIPQARSRYGNPDDRTEIPDTPGVIKQARVNLVFAEGGDGQLTCNGKAVAWKASDWR